MTAAQPTPVDHKLPDGWRQVRLGDVAEIRKGQSFTSRDLVPGDVPVIAGGMSPAYFHVTSNRPPETVTVSASGAHAGFVAFHKRPIFATDCSTVQNKGNEAVINFVFHFLKNAQDAIYYRRRGSAQPHVYPEDIASLHILLPPLPEQRAIAAVLDSIDDAIEGAEAVIAATERLRDALLHDLLTRGLPGQHSEWRDVPGLGTIPADWDVARLVDMLEEGPTNGIYKPDTEYGSGVCLIRIDDFGFGEFESFGNFQRIRATEDEIRRYEVREGDIVVNRVNSLSHIGKSVLIPKVNEPTLFESNMMRVRFDRNLDSRFGAMVLLSDNTRRYFKARAKKAVQQASINQQDVSELPIPLPPLAEQRTIAATLDGVDAAIRVAGDEQDGLRLLKDSTADALLTGRVRADSFVLSREHKLQDSCRQWKAR